MGFLIKSGIFALLITTISGRSVWLERNVSNSSEIEDSKSDCDCEWRYLKHYETKGCRVEQVNDCGCPRKFICPVNQSKEDESKVCKYQNKDYNIGSKIITSEVCQICRCREDDNGIPRISCISRECPPLEIPKDRSCHLIYKAEKCCPSGFDCVSEEVDETPESRACEYNDRFYPFGAKIYPVDDPCQICECNENWHGINNASCYQQECVFQRNKAQLDAGCIPVYHENKCCPIEFFCSTSHNLSYSSFENNGTLDETFEESGDQCVFAGRFYDIGVELYINSTCVKCQCQIPPDFTCVHQSCPSPPNAADCYAHYNPEQCCPQYECALGDEEMVSEIDESEIEDGCPTPLCADASCHIETPPGHECPTCVCKLTPIPDQSTLHLNQQQLQEVETERLFEDDVGDFDEYLVEMESLPKDSSDSEYPESMVEYNPQTDLENEGNYGDRNTENDEVIDGRSENEINFKIVGSSLPEGNEEVNQQTVHEGTKISNGLLEYNNGSIVNDPNRLQRIIQKRSESLEVNSVDGAMVSNSISVTPSAQQQDILHQGQVINQQHELNEDIEREGGDVKESNEDFDAELESFREKGSENDQKLDNKITVSGQESESGSVESSTEYVPEGCPTPLCADSTCRIMIPTGHHCPTCICKGDYSRQP